jgi:phosphatidylglycerol---prolipoprotein diacylglyceryl transferase
MDHVDRRRRSTRTLGWVGHVAVHAYPAMLAVGMTIGVMFGTSMAPRLGLDGARTNVALLVLLIPALVGSRLLHVAVNWERYRLDPARIWRRGDGGMSLYGGFVLALLVAWPLLRAFDLDAASFWDAGAIVILVGMAFTKIGCHLNGCCVGRAYDGWLSVRSADVHGVWKRRMPSQFLESGLALVILAGASWLRFRLDLPGSLLLGAAMGYGVARFWLEGTREALAGARVNRAISVLLAASACIVLVVALAQR